MDPIRRKIDEAFNDVRLRSEKIRNFILLLTTPLFCLSTIPSWMLIKSDNVPTLLAKDKAIYILLINMSMMVLFSMYQLSIRQKYLVKGKIPKFHQPFSTITEQIIIGLILLNSCYIWGAETVAVSPVNLAFITLLGLTVLCHSMRITITTGIVAVIVHTIIYSYLYSNYSSELFHKIKDLGPYGQVFRAFLLLISGIIFSFITYYQKRTSFSFARKIVGELRAEKALGRYVGEEIKEDILTKREEKLEEKNVCVMFIDMRGFTSYSEGKDPHQVNNLLRNYYEYILSKIEAYGGLVKSFMGDGIMTVFGYRDIDNCREKTFLCAKEILSDLKLFNEQNEYQFTLGIGIHYGPVVVGDIGNESRSEFAVIGNSVNLASRIESMTKEYDTSLLLSEEALPESYKEEFTFLEEAKIRGQNSMIKLYKWIS